MEVGIGKHKVASRNLRVALPHICAFVQRYLERAAAGGGESREPDLGEHGPGRIVVACETGKDLSVGVVLALLCRFQGGGGELSPCREEERHDINKNAIKIKLGGIMMRFPEANPSRATLQSVNSFLMG